MNGLIKRLRYAAQGELFGDTTLEEAADYIEELQAKLDDRDCEIERLLEYAKKGPYDESAAKECLILRAKLDAVNALPDKWRGEWIVRSQDRTENEQAYVDGRLKSANELDKAIGEHDD